ncbi:unnamed protein product, partial [marine sediment metagenome]
MASLGTMAVTLSAKTGQFRRDMARANQSVQKFSKSMDVASQKVTQAGKAMTIAVTLPLVALSTLAIKLASDAEEIGSKFEVVFRDIADDAERAAKSFAKNFDLADSTAKDLLGTTGDLLTGFGFSQEQALDLAEQVNVLAGDLTSLSNVKGGVRQASLALTKGLLGERESMKLLGISVKVGTKQWDDAIKAVKEAGNVTKIQAEALATLAVAQTQSKNALGDYARTQDSVANVSRAFGETLKELTESWGVLVTE